MRRFVLAAFAVSVLAACQPEAGPLTGEEVAAVRNIATSYGQAVRAGDADAVTALYALDAVEMPPDMPARMGRAAIGAAYTVALEGFSITSVEVDGRAGLAYDRGTWSFTGMAADTAFTVTGKYLVIAHEQVDGSWLWTNVIWNSDARLPQP